MSNHSRNGNLRVAEKAAQALKDRENGSSSASKRRVVTRPTGSGQRTSSKK